MTIENKFKKYKSLDNELIIVDSKVYRLLYPYVVGNKPVKVKNWDFIYNVYIEQQGVKNGYKA